jgi:hypothetical protein
MVGTWTVSGVCVFKQALLLFVHKKLSMCPGHTTHVRGGGHYRHLPCVPCRRGGGESRLEGVNRANLNFINLSTTTSRVSVRNMNESEREGEKQIASK